MPRRSIAIIINQRGLPIAIYAAAIHRDHHQSKVTSASRPPPRDLHQSTATSSRNLGHAGDLGDAD
jgi:hypothetical protein